MVKKKVKPGEYDLVKEGTESVLRINFVGTSYFPSVSESATTMAIVMDALVETPGVNQVVLLHRRNYVYDEDQTQILSEISGLYNYLIKQKRIISLELLHGPGSERFLRHWREMLQYVVLNLLRSDPIAAYVELKRLRREERIKIKKTQNFDEAKIRRDYLDVLNHLYTLLGETKLISIVKSSLAGFKIGNRALYKQVFHPGITPDFLFTKIMDDLPLEGEEMDAYKIDKDTYVTIFKTPKDIKYLYHVSLPEFQLDEDKYALLDKARELMVEHKPKKEEFTDPDKMRRVFFNIGRDLIQELATSQEFSLNFSETKHLAEILVRYTVGFGMIEILLKDPKIQDITINGPIGETPIFIMHQDHGECVTNIIPSSEDGEGWATKFRLLSGRPLDEANPVLDTELILPWARSRVAIMSKPLTPVGLAYAFRRHRDTPWTYPLFIKNGMMNGLAAGLLDFIVQGGRSMLFAGTRSSGKCVSGDTLIQLSDGDLLPIKDLIGNHKLCIDDGNVYHPKFNFKLPCLKKFNIGDSRITDVWKRKSPERLIKLKTKSGREIITTFEHPYFIYQKKLQTIRADKINKGDLIAIPRNLSVQGKRKFLEINEDYVRSELDDSYIIKGKTNAHSFKFPKEITSDLAEFLGFIVGDGHLDLKKLEFFNHSIDLRDRYKMFLNKLKIPFREFQSRTTWVVQVNCRSLSRILNKYFDIPFGCKSDKVVIPKLILKSDDLVLASFLRGYFDTDGYVPKNKRDIELATASKSMCKQLQMALLRFGIVNFSKIKRVNGKDYYRILIRGNFVELFGRKISFFHPFKRKRMNEILSSHFIDNTNVDTIPNGNEILRRLRKSLRLSSKDVRLSGKDYWAYENDSYRVSRNWFQRLVQFYRLHYKKLKSNQNQISLLRNFVHFDYERFTSSVEELKSVLGVSYKFLSEKIDYSDTAVRKTLQKSTRSNLNKIESIASLSPVFKERLKELESSYNNFEVTFENVPKLIESNVTSYAEIARNTKLNEFTLRYYLWDRVNPSSENVQLIKNELFSVKNRLLKRLKKARELLPLMKIPTLLTTHTQIGLILANLRRLLNVENLELLSPKVSSATIPNFFTGKYNSDIKTIQSLARNIVGIYDSCVNSETEMLLQESELLAQSDIFWDEVSSVEQIDKVDDFVYDLTVKDTHNFIANGLIAHNTSILGSTMVEIKRKYRIITVEDVEEIPVTAMRKMGYNIQPMKVRSALTKESSELGADEGIRTSLRFGDSSLIVGEVRSLEAKSLYEAMRIGSLANVVAGTIHGGDPYSVFDRVVNDLEVPKTSFKATDVIVVSNPVRSADGLSRDRRILQITEVGKHWEDDPVKEGGFKDLMVYDPKEDTLKPSADLLNGDSEILKSIAGNIRDYVGDWDALWENILLRAQVKGTLVELANKSKMPNLLEAKFIVQSNDVFHSLSEQIREEVGAVDNKRVFLAWEEWFKNIIKRQKFE